MLLPSSEANKQLKPKDGMWKKIWKQMCVMFFVGTWKNTPEI